MTSYSADDLVAVRLQRIPVKVYAQAQEHGDALMREFALIAQSLKAHESDHVPKRLVDLVEELNVSYAGLTAEQEKVLAEAVANGEEEIPELVWHLPAQVGPAAAHLGELMDEADAYCAAGQHLLTLATPPEAKRFRDWYLGEFIRQLDGEPPIPWPDYQG
jgi:hypothetical protein